ncbi:14624_t:CDS:2 [Entrophospora sp. SA101]|nr:14624_t:CDS:2 [Entrophospora sp. SA101]
MVQTYCVKCRAKTNSASEKLETTGNGQNRFIEAIAREKKEKAKERKKALQLAKKIINNQKS